MSVLWGIVPTAAVALVGVALIARPALLTAAAGAVRRGAARWDGRLRWGGRPRGDGRLRGDGRPRRDGRLATAREQLKGTLGPLGAWVMLCGAGLAVSVAVLWPLGRVALRLEGPWDRPVFAWFRDHPAGAGWHRLNEILTQVGNRPPIYATAIAAALVLFVFAPRRRWVPPALAIMAVLIEQVMRVGLLRAVDRGHPPTSMGTWPSGGVGRIIAIYGFIAFLLFWCARRRGLRVATARTAVVLGAVIALMATVEGYTRLYLLKHWLTDVLGGYVFGGLLLAVFVYAGRALLEGDVAGAGAGSAGAAGSTDAAGTADGPAGGAPAAATRPDDVMSANR